MTFLSEEALRLLEVDKKAKVFTKSFEVLADTLNNIDDVDSYKEILHKVLDKRRIEIIDEQRSVKKKPFINCFGIKIE